jgi:hypothetical protein
MLKDLLLKRIATLEEKMAASEQDRVELQSLRNELAKLSVHDFGESQQNESTQQLLKG